MSQTILALCDIAITLAVFAIAMVACFVVVKAGMQEDWAAFIPALVVLLASQAYLHTRATR
ncbi:MAG: hypothetical protein ABL993_02445 [Vicinamibacterales bacterium]